MEEDNHIICWQDGTGHRCDTGAVPIHVSSL